MLASPATSTCFIDGGTPARSQLIPGEGAPAPYTLDDRVGAYQAIMARVPRDRVTEVAKLTEHAPTPPAATLVSKDPETGTDNDAGTDTGTGTDAAAGTDAGSDTGTAADAGSDAATPTPPKS